MVYGVCRLLLRDREEAEDATQQTFLSAYRSLLRGTEPDEPAAWLGTIARNECRGRIRARAAAPLALVAETAEPADDVETLAHQRREVTALVSILAELPRHQREAIVLREFYGLSHEEVGHALGVTPSAVDSLLVRARRRLQTALRPARLASGALVLPLALRESLAQAMPGFAPGTGGGAFAKLVSLPIAAKLTATAATVGAVGVVAGSQPPPPPVAAMEAPPAPVQALRHPPTPPSEPPPPAPEPSSALPIAAVDDDADEGRARQLQRTEPQRDDEDDAQVVEQDREERDEPSRKQSSRLEDDESDEADEPEADEADRGSEQTNDSDDSDDSDEGD